MSDLKPFSFIHMGRTYQIEYANVTNLDEVKANVITSAKLMDGKKFRTYTIDFNRKDKQCQHPKKTNFGN